MRSVMKRVVEEVTLLDKQVSTLYEDGTKKEQDSGELWTLNECTELCLCASLHEPRRDEYCVYTHSAGSLNLG